MQSGNSILKMVDLYHGTNTSSVDYALLHPQILQAKPMSVLGVNDGDTPIFVAVINDSNFYYFVSLVSKKLLFSVESEKGKQLG